ncbi:hypothetical protein [Thalassotalea aquiviva]|uniref:hypothetical protein n=1 Tax=Thalassotalea aquiviva TaxID=3242415 RepID=UPI00352B200A
MHKTFIFLLCCFAAKAISSEQTAKLSPQTTEATTTARPAPGMQDMLAEFSNRHQALMPKVAIADMFYGCNLEATPQYSFEQLIVEMDKTTLAENLIQCLGDDNLASDTALNFGIKGCFIDQMSQLPTEQQNNQMASVEQAIEQLSRKERQRSFTQCVNNQTLKYIDKDANLQ